MPTYKRLFIAEKPAAAKALADFLARQLGVKPAPQRTFIVVGDDVISWLRGHLLELVDADHYDQRYGKWRIDDLPIIPNEFALLPRKGRDGNRSEATAMIAGIGKLLKDCETVVGFGDPDAEGQLIQDEVLHYLKNRKPVIRLWANALDDSTLSKALASMKPNVEYIGWFEQALCRSHSDWLYGINMTRACTIHARNAGATSPVYIGRVQTPTLALVVLRELDILNFKSVDYYTPSISLGTDPAFRATWMPRTNAKGEVDDPRVNTERLLTDKAWADRIIELAKKSGQARVLSATTKPGTESAPMPFSLTSLQALCSRLYGLGATQTLEVIQSLYDKKLASYPRVDTEFLPEDQHADAPKILASLAKASLPVAVGNALGGARPTLKSRAWNDAKVTAHHGIIPTLLDNPGEVARLSDIELKVYLEIVKRYVLQFWPQAKFMATELVMGVGTGEQPERFGAKGRRYTDDGWRKAFAEVVDADEDGADKGGEPVISLPQLTKDQSVPITAAGYESKKTKPKKRFTEGTLLTAMENIHEYVTDPEIRKGLREGAGIGTPATRAKIIDILLDSKRDLMVKKGKELLPTANGIRVIQLLPTNITSPDMTAVWQQFGAAVQARETTYRDFIARQSAWLTNLVKSSAGFFNPSQFPVDPNKPQRIAAQDTEHLCFGVATPGCGGTLRLISGQYGMFYKCTNDKCGKTFRQVDNNPAEKTPGGGRTASADVETYAGAKFKCKRCEPGQLLKKERKDKSGSFWGCSHWREADGGCKAAYNDAMGKPDFDGANKGKGSGGRGSSNSGGYRPSPSKA